MDALTPLRFSANPMMRVGGAADPAAELRNLRPAAAPLEVNPLADRATSGVGAAEPGRSFEGVLGQLVNEVNSKQLAAGDAVHGLLSGENIPLHRVVLATEEASVSFQLMVEVRNKLLEAYQELMRMQV